MVAVEAIAAVGECTRRARAVAERGQFQQRQVETAAVERHQLGPWVVADALPELLDDLGRPVLRLVQARQRLQRKSAHAQDAHGDRDLKRHRQEVGAVARLARGLGLARPMASSGVRLSAGYFTRASSRPSGTLSVSRIRKAVRVLGPTPGVWVRDWSMSCPNSVWRSVLTGMLSGDAPRSQRQRSSAKPYGRDPASHGILPGMGDAQQSERALCFSSSFSWS